MHGCNLRRASRSALSRGFTLTELLIVIGVIVLLMGLLMPGMGMVRQKAREASTLSLMGAVEQSAFMFRTDHNRMPGYFDSGQLASVNNNPELLTEGENVVLELSGGIIASGAAGGEGEGIYSFEMSGDSYKVNVMSVGASDGPGYLDLGQVHLSSQVDGRYVYSGSKVFRPMGDDDRTTNRRDDNGEPLADNTRPIPVVHDYFGKPLVMWSRNNLANTNFADVSSEFDETQGGRTRRSSYYWWANAGILGSEWQGSRSVIGVDLTSGGSPGGIRKPMVHSMYALLGHPAFHKPSNQVDGYVEPAVGLGELILQSAGADRVFLSHDGQDGSNATADGRNGRIEAYYEGNESSPEPNQRLMREFDDLVHAGG